LSNKTAQGLAASRTGRSTHAGREELRPAAKKPIIDGHEPAPPERRLPMTNNVVIALSCGTNDTNRATRAIHLATIAHKEGKNVTVFLLDEGVYLARQGIITNVRAATGDIADDLLAYLQAHEVPILVCTPCASARQIKPEDLIDGARMATAAEFIHMACGAAVISL
jgi:predicted peroxiredoxin